MEFLVALPLIIIFFVGMFELGRILAQTNWVSQTTYNAALIGAGAPGTAETRRENTEKLARELFDASVNIEMASGTPHFVADFNNSSRWVKVSYHGALRDLLPSFISKNLSVSSTLPLLGVEEATPPSAYQNPDPLLCDPTHERQAPTVDNPTGCRNVATAVPDCTSAPEYCRPPTAIPGETVPATPPPTVPPTSPQPTTSPPPTVIGTVTATPVGTSNLATPNGGAD